MDCPCPIKSVLPRFYPTWSSRTRPSMGIQRSEGLGSRLNLLYMHPDLLIFAKFKAFPLCSASLVSMVLTEL